MLRTSRANKITIVSIRTLINLLLINIFLRILSLSLPRSPARLSHALINIPIRSSTHNVTLDGTDKL